MKKMRRRLLNVLMLVDGRLLLLLRLKLLMLLLMLLLTDAVARIVRIAAQTANDEARVTRNPMRFFILLVAAADYLRV